MVEVALLLSAIAAVIAAVGTSVLSIVTSKKLLTEMKEVSHNTNSIKDELVAEVRKASFAAGKQDEKDRVSD